MYNRSYWMDISLESGLILLLFGSSFGLTQIKLKTVQYRTAMLVISYILCTCICMFQECICSVQYWIFVICLFVHFYMHVCA